MGKAIVIVGTLGTVAGVGYLLLRKFGKPKSEPASKASDASSSATTAEPEELPEHTEPVDEPNTAPAAPTAPTAETVDHKLEPLPGPDEPREPMGPALMRINRSQVTADGTVEQSPDELLAQARKFDPDITLDELTGARLAASEHNRGTFAELACIVDAELNRADRRGQSLFESLTHRGTFGKQGHERRASTRLDPRLRHLWAARAVLSGKARGISRGASRFFDPLAMERMHAKYRSWLDSGRQGKPPPIVSCDALTLLEAWSFDLGKQGENRCPPDRSRRGSHTEAWVGPIPGVDPQRLMLLKPLTLGAMHTHHYEAARAVLQGMKT